MKAVLNRKRSKPGSPLASAEDEESLANQSKDTIPKSNQPSNRAKVLLQKMCHASVGDNSKIKERVAALLKDVVGGIVLGTLGMSVLLLLDYYSIINLETARVFRKTASHIMFNTPEITAIIEEEDKKLMPMNEYNIMQKELSDSVAVIESEKKIVGARTMKETTLKAELDSLRGEYDKLIKDTGLDAFCPDCHWGMGMNCQQRVNWMLENYSDTATRIECVSKLVAQGTQNGKCIKT